MHEVMEGRDDAVDRSVDEHLNGRTALVERNRRSLALKLLISVR